MERDIKRLQACMEHKDYYAMLLYITMIIKKYTGENKEFLLQLQKDVKRGDYIQIEKTLKNFN